VAVSRAFACSTRASSIAAISASFSPRVAACCFCNSSACFACSSFKRGDLLLKFSARSLGLARVFRAQILERLLMIGPEGVQLPVVFLA